MWLVGLWVCMVVVVVMMVVHVNICGFLYVNSVVWLQPMEQLMHSNMSNAWANQCRKSTKKISVCVMIKRDANAKYFFLFKFKTHQLSMSCCSIVLFSFKCFVLVIHIRALQLLLFSLKYNMFKYIFYVWCNIQKDFFLIDGINH